MLDLSLIWAAIIALGIFIYVVLDGFDLGIGLLFPLFPDQEDRDVMMNTVAPVWDGNETWLVLGGACLLAAFPMVYAAVLSALYLPLMLMLVGLIFRGVAFEIRAKANRTRPLWDMAFIGGSALASFCQGVALGAYIQGIRVEQREFAGGSMDWLSPFSLFTGLGVVLTYAMLGAGWLLIKTDGRLQARLYQLLRPLCLLFLFVIALVSLFTPMVDPAIALRWFTTPNVFWLLPLPLGEVLCAAAIWLALQRRQEYRPYWLILLMVALAYIGFLISIWPHLIPPSITLWQAAAPASSQRFALYGAALILPIILAYTALGYWVFRGKVGAGTGGYH